jgi:protein-disulfide isomerase
MSERNKITTLVGVSLGLLVVGFTLFLTSGLWLADRTPVYDQDYQAVQSADALVTKVTGPATTTAPVILPKDYVRGDINAPVTITVFSDFACPYCQEISKVLNKVVTDFPTARLVWKDYPIVSLHADTMMAHLGAHCAGDQGKFWEFHDALFAIKQAYDRPTVLRIAQDLQLKPTQFANCLDTAAGLETIKINMAQGDALEIDGTPFVFVNDQRLNGPMTYEDISATVKLHTQIANPQK